MSHMIKSTDKDKTFAKMYHASKINLPEGVGIQRTCFNIIKAILGRHTANTIVYVDILQGNLLKP